MSFVQSILVPLDGSVTAARGLPCATWLATRLDARLHVLTATDSELPATDELRRLHVPEEYWSRLALHQIARYAEGAILSAIHHHGVELVVMSGRGVAADHPTREGLANVIGHVAQAVLEQSPSPVLLLPPGYREVLPWRRALVPVSGGAESDDALAFAENLARALDLALSVGHVASGESRDAGIATRTRYSDALHHEYQAQLDEMAGRAVVHDVCRHLESIALRRGDVARELIELVAQAEPSVVVIGWHGQLVPGRGECLKQLIAGVGTPILLVKVRARPGFRLKVGDELE